MVSCFVLTGEGSINIPGTGPPEAKPMVEMDSVILIEDDETTIKAAEKTEVECVGNELMDLATGIDIRQYHAC